jgi:hypothetical protein
MKPECRRRLCGVCLVLAGTVMLVLPGPGLPLLYLGLRRLGFLGG